MFEFFLESIGEVAAGILEFFIDGGVRDWLKRRRASKKQAAPIGLI
jgi:hypothetical protein